MLAGRVEEQAALQDLIESVKDGLSGALVLRGEAGVGKTALLDHVAELAAQLNVTRLAGLESESQLGFAGLHRLLIPYLASIDRLPPTQGQALRTAMGLGEGTPAHSFLLGLSVLTLLAEATKDRPLILIIDDAQWLDAESLEVLGFVARRLYAERIGLIFGVREPAPQPVLEGIPALLISGLGILDAAALLLSLAPGRVDPQVAERVALQSRGNPLVIHEVSRELNASQSSSGLLLDDLLPMGERLEKHFRQQIAALPGDCQRLLLFAAAHANPDSRLLWNAAASDGLDVEAAEAAVKAGLVRTAPTFEFRHPLIRSAVYTSATGKERRHAHEVLARLTDPEADPDLKAWHLAAAAIGPDESVAAQLEEVAQSARARGGFLSEAAYLARAAELSPDPSSRATRLLSAAQAALTGGAPLRAQSLLEAGLPHIRDPFLQAQAQKLEANALHRAGRPGHYTPATLLSAAKVFAPVDAALAAETMLEALEQTLVRGHSIAGATPEEIGRAALAMTSGTHELVDLLLASTGTFLCFGYVEAAPLMRRALDALSLDSALTDQVPRWFSLGLILAQLMWDERAAYDWLVRCEQLARQTGALEVLMMTLIPLSGVEIVFGRLAVAEARVADVRQLSRAVGVPEERIEKMGNSRLLAWLGLDEEARDAASRSYQEGVRIGAGNSQRLSRLALVVVEMGRGRYVEAFTICKLMLDEDVLGLSNEALPNVIESGIRSGHVTEATSALLELRERATASGTSWALGLLARSEALLAVENEAETLYLQAIEHLQRTEAGTDLARTHLLYGEWLRRQKRRSTARAQLRLAQEMFEDMGAAAFAERARAELHATGERNTVSIDGLTPQEAQIARLAADGATNQEIATQLFISSHTVDHLRKVFRKLEVSNRRKLGAALQ